MAANRDEIDRLLREGLDLYGNDDVDGAVHAWKRVLELDAGNADARDYIEAAGAEPARGAADTAHDRRDATLLEEALALAAGGGLADAHALLEGGLRADDLDLESLAVLELVRARLLPAYRDRFATGGAPRLAVPAGDLARYHLPAQAAFLVSLCDGRTPLDDLAEAAGMDEFDVLHNLGGLVDSGLVSIAS
ncbi:MAG: hypothetical protein R3E88_20155 [Myxococcota bacterium]